MFGAGAMTNSIDEIRDADLLFVIGSNTTEAHPIIAMEMKRAVLRGARLLVADPRSIWLTDIAEKPPADWDVERRRRYFEWAIAVVDGCRGVNAGLESCFDEAVAKSAASVEAEAS